MPGISGRADLTCVLYVGKRMDRSNRWGLDSCNDGVSGKETRQETGELCVTTAHV